jgi:DNA-binding transcriptional LysR family regulator
MDRLACDRMFAAVMESGSFTAAADRLGTTSGQASKLVSRLEGTLGVRLLNRTTRAVSPTEAGQAYFDRLRPLLDEFDSLDAAVRDVTQAPRGRLRLTAPLTFGGLELTPILNDFALRWPEIELDVSFSDRVVNLVDEGALSRCPNAAALRVRDLVNQAACTAFCQTAIASLRNSRIVLREIRWR